ncbi:GTP cyclohydrolase II, partial [Nowakowskiella sp. JEL0407]
MSNSSATPAYNPPPSPLSLYQKFLLGKTDSFTLMGHSVHLENHAGKDTLVISASIASNQSLFTNPVLPKHNAREVSVCDIVLPSTCVEKTVISEKEVSPYPKFSQLSESTLKSLAAYISPLPTSQSHHTQNPQINANSNSPLKIECVVRARIPTSGLGTPYLHVYKNSLTQLEHMAIVYGDIYSKSLNAKLFGENDLSRLVRGALKFEDYQSLHQQERENEKEQDVVPLVRIHSSCITGETVGSARCDCADQLYE